MRSPPPQDEMTCANRELHAGGPVDPVAFTKAKHDWIVGALARLGLAGH
jgi:hypothetical protein